MVKKDKGVVDHNDGGEAESESGIVVPPHKCSNFSLAVMLMARQVCPVVEGHDAAGSASLTELGPLELSSRFAVELLIACSGTTKKNISCIQPLVRPELFAIATLSLTGRHRRRHHQLQTAVLHTYLTVALPRTRLATHEEKEGRGGGGDR
uniref:Uncharacterized protein n=1 Tax=Oryza nivara TaxID=4536 RepID=A0A0E0GC12_ORYNI